MGLVPDPAARPFTIAARQEHPDVTLITLTGEVDMITAPRLRAALHDARSDASSRCPPGPATVVVDCRAVTFFAAAGAHPLVAAARQGVPVRLVLTEHSVVEVVVELTGLPDLCPVHRDVHEALTAGAGPPSDGCGSARPSPGPAGVRVRRG